MVVLETLAVCHSQFKMTGQPDVVLQLRKYVRSTRNARLRLDQVESQIKADVGYRRD